MFSTPEGLAARQGLLISVFGRRRVHVLVGHRCWLAKRAGFEAMYQAFPPGPALFLALVLVLKPSGFRQLLAKLWVTHPILKPFASVLAASILRLAAESGCLGSMFSISATKRKEFANAHDYSTSPAGI